MNPIFEGLTTAIKGKLELNINITLKTMELNELIEMGVIVNLYKNPKMWDEETYFSKEDLEIYESEEGIEFLDHLYSLPFKSPEKDKIEMVFSFLDNRIGTAYRDKMFQPNRHAPAIGIYNSITNHLLTIGIGRKNRIFIQSTDESITEHNYSKFSNHDHLNVVSKIAEYLENAADYQMRIMEAIDDEDQESESEYSESLDEAIDNLIKAVPLLSNWMGDLSPGDF